MEIRALFCLPGIVAAIAAGLVVPPATAGCVDERTFDTEPAAAQAPPAPTDPRAQLASLVRDALSRSQALGAARLLAEAAQDDVEETRAGKDIHASAVGNLGPAAQQSGSVTQTAAMQMGGTVSVTKLVYDGGRTDRLVDWRAEIAESARYAQLSTREQVAMSAVALAIDRDRYRMQVKVYRQYMSRMSCLVDALQTIVRADHGRASELVQARKSQQEAELSMTLAQSQVRQVEVQLRRLVGDGLPTGEGISSLLLTVPGLPDLQADVAQAADIEQLDADAAAAWRYAEAAQASTKPQVSWSFGGTKGVGAGGDVPSIANRSGSLQVGLSVSIPLYDPSIAWTNAAARKRAEAAALQRDDALVTRRYRVAEVYEQTESAFDRARRTAAVLRDSEEVRDYTLQQWQQLGRRSLFDVMAAEGDHYNLRIAYVNAIHDGQQLNAILLSLGRGVTQWLR